ncbi:MAG TPA: hypothetical protein VJ951_09750 [Bacteroidales bacterium]|nr:hypothetical protein [Bacteroidales bacterium]
MKVRYLFFILIFICLQSCENEDFSISGQVLLSSEYDFKNYTIEGFIFESQEFVPYSSTSDIVPDILVDQIRLVDGSLKAGFTSPGNNNGFALVNSFDSFENSMDFYNDYTEADSAMSFSPSTDTLKLYQVWLFKSTDDHYAKIHVKEINTVQELEGQYLNVLLDYYYQQDGTPAFP